MKLFNIPFKVCVQNLRKLLGDYRVIVAVGIMFIICNYHASWFLKFEEINFENTGVAPWIFPFAFTRFSFVQVLMFTPLLFLFCDAPFIDANQPYIISRCSRLSWSLGQIFYIISISGIYVFLLVLMMALMLIGNMDLTVGWGDVINTAAKNLTLDYALSTGATEKVVQSFSPISATLYSMILMWFAGIFIGLLIYVINAATKKNGFGIIASCFFIIVESSVSTLNGINTKFQALYRFSPLSWCSIQRIKMADTENLPTIMYVLSAYAVLIIGLSAAAVLISKKQEIKVVQSV